MYLFPGVSVVPTVPEGVSPGGISGRSGRGEEEGLPFWHSTICSGWAQHHTPVLGDGGHPETSEWSGDAWASILGSWQGHERESQHQASTWQGEMNWQVEIDGKWEEESQQKKQACPSQRVISEKCGCECESEFCQNPKSIQIYMSPKTNLECFLTYTTVNTYTYRPVWNADKKSEIQ